MRIDLDPADLFVLAGFAPPHRIPSHKKSLIAGETFDQAIAKRYTSVRVSHLRCYFEWL